MAKSRLIEPLGAEDKIRILVNAHPGRGKTVLAASSAEVGPTLLIRSPLDHLPVRAMTSKAEQAVVRNWTDMFELLEYLRHEPDAYDWVWLDSISLIQDVGLDDIWAAAIERKPSRREYGPDKGEYGVNMGRLAEWVRFVVGANAFNFGITAHPFEVENTASVDGGNIWMPWIQGKGMTSKICGYMNMVTYYDVKRRKDGTRYRVLYSQENASFYAKDQYDAFGEKGLMIDPDMKKIVTSIDKARGTATTPARRTTRRRPTATRPARRRTRRETA